MPNRIYLSENECDSSIYTHVHLGRKIQDVPKEWALNLYDIREFIPVLNYEFECYIMIHNIISPCKIRINPRILYSGNKIKEYLRSQKIIDKNKKIKLEIKFNKNKLYNDLNEFSKKHINYIDTKLLVGKSYKSKGWTLSNNVKSKIFPLNAYNFMYPAYIDGIQVEARLYIQIRLFFTSSELSQELEKLSKKNSKDKVDARIIINEEYLKLTKSLVNNHLSDSNCVICGNPIDKETKSNKCFDCLDKELTVLKLKSILELFNYSDQFYEEDLINLGFTKGKIKLTLYKLEKYGLVSKDLDEKFKIKDQSTIEKFIKEWG